MKAERLLAKVEAGMVPVGPSDDREMITEEERSVFRRIGLRMKSYLPMGQHVSSFFFLCFIVPLLLKSVFGGWVGWCVCVGLGRP